MKEQSGTTGTTTLGQFLKLMLAIAERRARTEHEVSPAGAASEIGSAIHPRPIALGPFLTLVLTLAARKVAEQAETLRSSMVPAGAGYSSNAGRRRPGAESGRLLLPERTAC